MKSANVLEYYAATGPMTRAGSHGGYLGSAPSSIRELAETVQQLFLYDVVAKDFYGFDVPRQRVDEIHLRSIELLLDRIIQLDDEPLAKARSLGKRTIGRCHHFALMTVAVLRAHGISARARCGFGAYFNPPQFEDHWVCEYWDAGERRWVLADTQLDAVWIEKLGIQHDVLDAPRDQFLTAADAWKQCRTGKLDPARFGISFVKLHGLWFVAGSLVRDLASLNKVEMLPWDSWGAQPEPETKLDDSQLRFFDEIADMTGDVDMAFDAVREKYSEDERLRVPQKVFNGLKQRLESVAEVD
jgi:Transglutaminase-like superfamily